MATNYFGKYLDLLSTVAVDKSIFVKCTTAKEAASFRVTIVNYSKRSKRKFKTSLVDQQLKVTRVS